MHMTRDEERALPQAAPVTRQSEPPNRALPDWSEFWPGRDSAPDGPLDDLAQEILSALEQSSVQDRLAGYRSESQGE